MLRIEVDMTNARSRLGKLEVAVGPKTVLKVITQRLVAYIDESFKTRGRGAWRPLAASTLALRQRGGDVPLQDTGEYRKGWTGQIDPSAPNPPALTDDETFVEVGTASGLARWHEYGTAPHQITAVNRKTLAARMRSGGYMVFGKTVNHPGMPARPVLPTAADATRLLQATVQAMLDRVAEGAD